MHGEKLPNCECARCGDIFYAEYKRVYCSTDCRNAAVSYAGTANPNYRQGMSTGTCDLCGNEFEYYPSEKKGRYCPSCVEREAWQSPPSLSGSKNPRWNGGKRAVRCTVCGVTIKRYPSAVSEVVVCSEDCRRTWLSDAFSGPDHPNWAGGANLVYGKGWSRIRKRALERDEYRCLVCGAPEEELGQNPDVHHIVPVRWFVESPTHEREDAHTLKNVVSLCRSCHRKAESGEITRNELTALIDA